MKKDRSIYVFSFIVAIFADLACDVYASNANANVQVKDQGCCLDLLSATAPSPEELAKFDAEVSKIKNMPGGLWLVIGESLAAPHAIKRFSKQNWIFLDPDPYGGIEELHPPIKRNMKRYSRIGIKGFIKDLNKLKNSENLKGSINYIVDDPYVLRNIRTFEDVVPSGASTYEDIILLHDFLAEGGMLTTSTNVLANLNPEQVEKLTKMYDIKYSFKTESFAKPYVARAYLKEKAPFSAAEEAKCGNWVHPAPDTDELLPVNQAFIDDVKRLEEARSKPLIEYKQFQEVGKKMEALMTEAGLCPEYFCELMNASYNSIRYTYSETCYDGPETWGSYIRGRFPYGNSLEKTLFDNLDQQTKKIVFSPYGGFRPFCEQVGELYEPHISKWALEGVFNGEFQNLQNVQRDGSLFFIKRQ